MKIRLLIASVLMTVSVFGQNVPSYVPTNGLVGWWPFNGNANDESGNGNNGSVNGATLTIDRYGAPNSAFYFNGSQHIVIPNSPSLNSNYISISVWFLTIDSTPSSLLYKTDALAYNEQFACELNYPSPTINLWSIKNGSNCNNPGIGWQEINVDSVLYDSTWHNLICTYNGSISKLYLDGVLMSSGSFGMDVMDHCGGELNIGKAYSSTSYFEGSIDDIGIWNRELSVQEVANIYNGSLPNTSIPIFNCPGAFMSPQLANGLVGWWPFCGDADDESGNGNNGTVNGATLTSDRFGNVNSAYEFDGVDDYIDVPSGASTTLNIIGDHSVSFYIKSGLQFATSNASIILSFGDHNTPSGGFIAALNINPTVGGPFSYHTSDPWVFINDSISNLYWSHFLVTQNSDTLSIYMNGVLRNRVTNHPQVTSWNGLRRIGVRNDLNSEYYMGALDDIGIWNRALDSSEVAQLYNTGLCTQTIAGSCDTLIFNANITGFNPVTYGNQVKVYPNPAADNLVIDCGTNYAGLNGYSIRITNLLGQTVYNSPVTAQITNIQLIPPTWVNGTYVVQFVHPNGTVMETKRIIIQ